jgi:hypothetical protein
MSHKWKRTWNIWPFELDLSHSSWWSPVPSILLQMMSLFISCWASWLFLQFGYYERAAINMDI